MKFSIKDFFSKYDQILSFPADLVIFAEKFLKRKLHFWCSAMKEMRTLERNELNFSKRQTSSKCDTALHSSFYTLKSLVSMKIRNYFKLFY